MLRERVATINETTERLAAHAEELHSLGVRSLHLFGSVARGEARFESDIDLLVEFEEVPGFVGYVRLRNRLQEILGHRVDLVMASGLHPRLRERVLREAQRVA
jgi:predicted nucleotidyltransferase